ncbi:MAG: cytochrome c3 family protein [Xanthomonadaceae bacterium]|nr:cytochrome c3 family protein [Xanthomonadaceae bacterium]
MSRKLFGLVRSGWKTLSRPSRYYSLGFLSIGGFVCGILFWGGFNTALELTNTEPFCISCHEMRSNVYQELQGTIHFTNRSGVRATCPDCHVPHDWTDKIARKMQASKEVWGWLFGTINTREKFLDHRLEMAMREWRRLKANDSLECRNCHAFEYMDFTRQSPRAERAHIRGLQQAGLTCIDCHKGIAHDLPPMEGIEGWDLSPRGQATSMR